MAKNKLRDLRDHLFETIEALKDDEKPMEIERAKAISGVAQALIASAKVELQFLELTGQESQSEFLCPTKSDPLLPAASKPNGGAQARQRSRP